MQALGVDRATTRMLVDESFSSLEELAYVPLWELAEVAPAPELIA